MVLLSSSDEGALADGISSVECEGKAAEDYGVEEGMGAAERKHNSNAWRLINPCEPDKVSVVLIGCL